ncbi:hypothetical protein V6N11_047270 [Hibiscus sabdariffa]|uniref:40S ribosomal protein S15 n=2 Tax=Hibiscus sabdariffa TaxID=183260 RepID=A0ABR2A0D3_9ROSI
MAPHQSGVLVDPSLAVGSSSEAGSNVHCPSLTHSLSFSPCYCSPISKSTFANSLFAPNHSERTFKKFSFRGVDLDALLDMSTDELVKLFPARARRRFQRGLKRKPMALIKKLRKAES